MFEIATPTTPAVAVYDTRADAELGVKELERAGVDIVRLSIIGRDVHVVEQALGYSTVADRVRSWGARGAAWGGLSGAFFGSAFIAFPASWFEIAGPATSWLLGGLEGAVIGGAAGLLAAIVHGWSARERPLIRYESRMRAGRFEVVVDGNPAMVAHARAVLDAAAVGARAT